MDIGFQVQLQTLVAHEAAARREHGNGRKANATFALNLAVKQARTCIKLAKAQRDWLIADVSFDQQMLLEGFKTQVDAQ